MKFDAYQLPNGDIVPCDASACKGEDVIDFTLADGTIVEARLYIEHARHTKDECDELCHGCVPCYIRTGATICDKTCEHWYDNNC